MKRLLIQAGCLTIVLVAVGCKDASSWSAPALTPAPPAIITKKEFKVPSAAGVVVPDPAPDKNLWTALANSHGFSSRPDPFALQPRERAYDVSQGTERMFGDIGGFDGGRFEVVDETVIPPEVEPQPYRRLAGVIVGDSVLALIDMGTGQLTLIHPGQDIEGWHVVSIDGDKAVLRRGGNRLPHEIVVRLEEPPLSGGTPNGGQGNGNNPGGPGPGGFPPPPPPGVGGRGPGGAG